ncbi:MAG: MBL fold hydrolase [Bacteroidales bacterium 45-6]|nr:MAG: MBL fold hydrolase [Bacteroidales bacterium 45-6]
MKIKQFEFNPIRENTYVAYDETNECVIIDPGCFYPDEKMELLDFILDNDLVVKHLLNTHLHFDHVFGCKFIEERLGMLTHAHAKDEFLLDKMSTQLKMFGFPDQGEKPSIGTYIQENDVICFGNQKLAVLEVPGHSPGSVVFYSEEGQCAFVGDVLFRGSIGRTDLEGGNFEQLIGGIRQKLFKLPSDTIVYSGHGPCTTIGYEQKNNPYLL